jgi:hypothetical protein
MAEAAVDVPMEDAAPEEVCRDWSHVRNAIQRLATAPWK